MQPRYLTSLNLETFTKAARAVPYQRIDSDLFPGVEVWIRRDDLLDPIISGNKAYKLLYNLIEAREQGADTLITCGGAWSNHIHATAAAGARFGFKTVGIIRGERPPVLSSTLQDAERFGMRLKFITREQYRQRNEPEFPQALGMDLSSAAYIPEGGANLAGARGAQLLGETIETTAPIRFHQLWLACGTGLTLAGVQHGVGRFPVIGVEILKAGDSIECDVQRWMRMLNADCELHPSQAGHTAVPRLKKEYHCGGYARYPRYLCEFSQSLERQTGIPLEPVYTAKLLYGLHREVMGGRIPHGSRVLALHSGGLQGWRGFQRQN